MTWDQGLLSLWLSLPRYDAGVELAREKGQRLSNFGSGRNVFNIANPPTIETLRVPHRN